MPESPLRVCLIAPLPPPYGGIGHWTLMVTNYAASRSDVQFHVVNTAPRWRAFEDLAIWKRVLGGGLQLLRDVLRVLKEFHQQPAVVHLTTCAQLSVIRDLVILWIARRKGIPVIYHLRFGRIPQLACGSSREWRLLSHAMRRAHTVVAIDAATTAAIRRHLPEVHVIETPNCIDLATLPPSEMVEDGPRVMFLGLLIPSKGIEELLQAWAELRPPGWQLQIVGHSSPEYLQHLQNTYRPEDVEFLGNQPHTEAMRLLAATGVFVLPSHTEGFPNVIVESMALGKPIIATRVGAIPEMLANDCGMLIDAHDVPALKEALGRMIGDADLRRRLGGKARERARKHYALDVVFSQYMTIWREAAGLE